METALVAVIASLIAIIGAGVKVLLDAVRSGDLVAGTTHREVVALLTGSRDQNHQLADALTVTASELADVKRTLAALRKAIASGRPVAPSE